METQEIFKKIFVNGKEENLPKEEGYYIASCKNYAVLEYHFAKEVKRDWLKDIDWYLQSIQEQPIKERIKPFISNEEAVVSRWIKEDIQAAFEVLAEKYNITVSDIETAIRIYINGKNKQPVEMPTEWIDVKDKFPEEDVLLLTTSKVSVIGDWYKGQWRTNQSTWKDGVLMSVYKTEDITHWMPLPKAPKELRDQITNKE